MDNPDKRMMQIYTVPNVITMVRLIMVPVAFAVLVSGNNDTLAFVLFAVASTSDFLDGLIARSTHSESELGAMLDPLVDRFLLAAGVIGLYVIGRMPLWILATLISRDVYLLYGSARLRAAGIERIRVLYVGKAATWFLLLGFSGLILNWPLVPGLGWMDTPWLPGLGGDTYCVWIWSVYVGFICSMIALVWYRVVAGIKKNRHDFESKTLPDPIKK